jgi:hypothetical protein
MRRSVRFLSAPRPLKRVQHLVAPIHPRARLLLPRERNRILDVANDAPVHEVQFRREVELNRHAVVTADRIKSSWTFHRKRAVRAKVGCAVSGENSAMGNKKPRRFKRVTNQSDRFASPPSQREKTTTSRDQSRKSGTDDRARYWYRFSKPNLCHVSQPNGTCERHTGNKLTGRRSQSEEVLSASTERKQEAEQRARLVERVDGRRTVGGRIEVEDGLSEIKAGDGGSQVVQDVVWCGLDPSLSLGGGRQDLSARKLNKRANRVDVAEDGGASLIRRSAD